jgi:hypothetical protein
MISSTEYGILRLNKLVRFDYEISRIRLLLLSNFRQISAVEFERPAARLVHQRVIIIKVLTKLEEGEAQREIRPSLFKKNSRLYDAFSIFLAS